MTYPWTGNIPSAGSETVTIPNVFVTPMSTNTVNFTLANPNGNTDQNPSNDNSSTTFAGLGSADIGAAEIDITTDNYGDEITWVLKEGGAVIAQGGPYTAGAATTIPTVYATLTAGNCYSFIMYDSYGDGILSPGFYMVKDATGTILASGGSNYTTEDQTNLETASIVIGIEEINQTQIDNRMCDVLGREFKDYNSIPNGTLYIQNKNKHLKIKQ